MQRYKVESNKSNLYAFDLDFTLVSVNSSFEFGLFLYRRGFIPLTKVCFIACFYALHRLHLIGIEKLYQAAFFRSKNISLEALQSLAAIFVKEKLLACLNPTVYALFKEAKQKGSSVVILSSSPDFILKPFSQALKADDYLATSFVFDKDGLLCKMKNLVDGKKKAAWIRERALKLGLLKKHIFAYSDSILDLPFLLESGHPVVISPDKKLRKLAVLNQWKILNIG